MDIFDFARLFNFNSETVYRLEKLNQLIKYAAQEDEDSLIRFENISDDALSMFQKSRNV